MCFYRHSSCAFDKSAGEDQEADRQQPSVRRRTPAENHVVELHCVGSRDRGKRSIAFFIEVCSHSLGVGAADASFLRKPPIAFFARKDFQGSFVGVMAMAVVAFVVGFVNREIAFAPT